MKVIIVYSLLICSLHAQGPLAPTSGPGPTQKSLQEIWDKLQSVESTVSLQQQQISLLQQQNTILLDAAGVTLPWEFSTVAASVDEFANPSLAFSPSGNPAVAFRNASAGSLHYAILNGSTWQVSLIDGPGYLMESPSLTFDATGNPMVAYYSNGHSGGINRGLTLAKWNGTSWIKTVLVGGEAGFGCDLVISPSGEPTIAYDDSDLNALRLARQVGGTWQFETITTSFRTGRRPSLAFRQDGTPAVAFKDLGPPEVYPPNLGIYFAIKEDGVWQTETIAEREGEESEAEYSSPSLAFSPSGKAAVTYDSYVSQGELNYAIRLHPDDWASEFVAIADDWGFEGKLLFNRIGQPCVGYLTNPNVEETDSSLAYAVLKGATWERTYAGRLSFSKFAGSADLAFAPNGQPVIAFHDPTSETVGVATRGIFVSP